ncbi:hypothetical protein [Sandaracinus amylolyticus]|uniref:hypothetical protein n=1 Tax=Sandaracinus amylolyticus TaxID=927083 RepID=UPI001F3486A4|nr:hypothetical protein [Sandaracinus amylolyticus]UJR81892.1 Hypothetical protein I5071_39570 [Sandaracinus amylolyticus]
MTWIDRERLVGLADASIAALDAPADRTSDTFVDATTERAHAQAKYGALATALPLAAAILGAEGDPLALRYLRATRGRTEGYDDRNGSLSIAIAQAIEQLVTLAGPRALPEARKLVGKRTPTARAAIARGLAPHAAGSADVRALLYDLHGDEDDTVRAAAREALGGHGPPAWHGVFPADPLSSRSAEDARRLRKPLDAALAALVEPPWKHEEAQRAIRRAMRALPDDVAGAILTRFFCRDRAWDHALGVRWLRATGGLEIGRVLDARPYAIIEQLEMLIPRALAECAEPVRARALETLLPALGEQRSADRYVAERIVTSLASLVDDLRPLVALALGAPLDAAASVPATDARAHTPLTRAVASAISARTALGPLAESAVAALEAGFPGAWSLLATPLRTSLLASEDPRVTAYAERALALSDDPDALTFALQRMARVRGRAGRALLVSALDAPRLRAVVIDCEPLRRVVMRTLRAQLAAGRLAGDEIAIVLRAITAHARSAPPSAAELARARDALDALLSDPASPDALATLGALLVELARTGVVAHDHPAVEHLFAAVAPASAPPLEIRLYNAALAASPPWVTVLERLAASASYPARDLAADALADLRRDLEGGAR